MQETFEESAVASAVALHHAAGHKDVDFPEEGMTSGGGGGGGGAENGANTSGGSNDASDGAHHIEQHPQDASASSAVSSPYSGGMQPQQPGSRANGGGGGGSAGAAAGYFQTNGASEAPNAATSTASSYPSSYGNRALSQVRDSYQAQPEVSMKTKDTILFPSLNCSTCKKVIPITTSTTTMAPPPLQPTPTRARAAAPAARAAPRTIRTTRTTVITAVTSTRWVNLTFRSLRQLILTIVCVNHATFKHHVNDLIFKFSQFYGAAAGVGAASSASGYPMAAAAAAYGAVAANHHQSGHQQHNSHHQVRDSEICFDITTKSIKLGRKFWVSHCIHITFTHVFKTVKECGINNNELSSTSNRFTT